jgi:hypothetical protein
VHTQQVAESSMNYLQGEMYAEVRQDTMNWILKQLEALRYVICERKGKKNIAGSNYRFHIFCSYWHAFCPNPLSSHFASRLSVLSKNALKSPMIHPEVREHVQCYIWHLQFVQYSLNTNLEEVNNSYTHPTHPYASRLHMQQLTTISHYTNFQMKNDKKFKVKAISVTGRGGP